MIDLRGAFSNQLPGLLSPPIFNMAPCSTRRKEDSKVLFQKPMGNTTRGSSETVCGGLISCSFAGLSVSLSGCEDVWPQSSMCVMFKDWFSGILPLFFSFGKNWGRMKMTFHIWWGIYTQTPQSSNKLWVFSVYCMFIHSFIRFPLILLNLFSFYFSRMYNLVICLIFQNNFCMFLHIFLLYCVLLVMNVRMLRCAFSSLVRN